MTSPIDGPRLNPARDISPDAPATDAGEPPATLEPTKAPSHPAVLTQLVKTAATAGAPAASAAPSINLSLDHRRIAAALDALVDQKDDIWGTYFFGDVLKFLSPSNRERVLTAAIHIEIDANKAVALAGVMDGAAYLDDSQRERLVAATIGIDDEYAKWTPLARAGRCMEHLNEAQREDIIAAAIDLDQHNRPLALAGLWAGMPHLKEAQRSKIVRAALALETDSGKASALEGIETGIACLSQPQRKSIVDAALSIHEERAKDIALGALGPAIAHLSQSQRKDIVDAVVSMKGGQGKATALTGLWAGMHCLNGPQQEALFDAALDIPAEYKRMAFRNIGPIIGLMNDAQREQLLDAACSDNYDRAGAIAELAAGITHFNEAQCERLVIAALIEGYGFSSATTIAGLGAVAAHLNDNQRWALVDSVSRLHDDQEKAWAIAGIGDIGGLAAGMAGLSETERDQVIDAVISTTVEKHKATTISSLGRDAFTALNKAQRKRLIDAAEAIESKSDRAHALSGLAYGLGKASGFLAD